MTSKKVQKILDEFAAKAKEEQKTVDDLRRVLMALTVASWGVVLFTLVHIYGGF